MKIGEASKLAGISTSAIRFYERHGLLNSSRISRAENGYRIYTATDIEEILLIVKFKDLGLELEEIKRLLTESSNSCSHLLSSIDTQLIKFRKIHSLIKIRIELLESAKIQCESKCSPKTIIKKCCA